MNITYQPNMLQRALNAKTLDHVQDVDSRQAITESELPSIPIAEQLDWILKLANIRYEELGDQQGRYEGRRGFTDWFGARWYNYSGELFEVATRFEISPEAPCRPDPLLHIQTRKRPELGALVNDILVEHEEITWFKGHPDSAHITVPESDPKAAEVAFTVGTATLEFLGSMAVLL
jgi:hypothetical protein